MTTRVFDCERPVELRVRPVDHRPRRSARLSRTALFFATLVAVLAVPLAGAAEPPYGWPVAGTTALLTLLVAAAIGHHVPWGWLAALAAVAGVAAPRGPYGVIGPALLVATLLCTILWLGSSRRRRLGKGARDEVAEPRDRAAQVIMGLSGERRTSQVLATELPQDYVLINGLTLPRAAGDIDHLVVGPTGVFLLETKTMAGQIVCQADGTWRRTKVGRGGTPYVAFIGDPAAQVQRNIFTVRECLRKRLPHLLGSTSLWIDGLVVFAHPQTQLDVKHSRVPAMLLESVASRICQHAPRRRLQPREVDAIVQALLEEAGGQPGTLIRQSAQSLVEVVLALPLILSVVFGTIAISRAVQTESAVVLLAHEAARAGALGHDPRDAAERILQCAGLVAPGLGLDLRKVALDWDLSQFSQDPGQVMVSVRYPIDYGDLPLSGWIPLSTVRAEHAEWVDPYRSGMSSQTSVTH